MSQEITEENKGIVHRIRAYPRPASVWLLGALILFAFEFGALVDFVLSIIPGIQTVDIPTLLSRELIPNQGYKVPGQGWTSTFLGLEPAYAWLIRVALVYAYAFCCLGWAWYGYMIFREHYRFADWTPRDDMIDRLRGHRWGQFGFVIVAVFVVAAIFAPTIAPVTLEANIIDPYSHQTKYFDQQVGKVTTVTVGRANLLSQSVGSVQQNIGLFSYDDFGRYHPFGTMPNGKDVFTFMVYGARMSLFISVVGTGIGITIAVLLVMLTAYYKGLVDLLTVVASDGVSSIPLFVLLIMLSYVFGGTWVASLYSGGFLLALIFGGFYWTYFWRVVRGPTYQTVESEWVDAARSFGQRPLTLMRKHVMPYSIGYLLVYASLSVGGIIIAAAALSYLGIGVDAPTPAWGRLISLGQSYIPTASWHISVIPGVAIVLLVTGLNALGDGIRDAIDPESEGETGGGAVAAGGGA